MIEKLVLCICIDELESECLFEDRMTLSEMDCYVTLIIEPELIMLSCR